MGIRLIVEVMDHAPADLTWRERWALVVLAETANDTTRECWPGIEDDPEIAHRMRLPARSSRYEVIQALRLKGALASVSAGHRGRRAVYRVPVLSPQKGPGFPDPNDEKGSGNPGSSVREPQTQSERKGPESTDPKSEKGSGNDLERVRDSPRKGPENPDPYPSDSSVPSSQLAGDSASPDIPAAALPLVEGLRDAGVSVRWPFRGNQWFPVLGLINDHGIPAMVDQAVKAASRTTVESAKYFLKGWGELPPLPPPGAARPLRAVHPGGHQPFQPPADPTVYANGF